MYKFAVINRLYADKTVAYLFYDETNGSYQIEIPENVKSVEAPPIIADFIEKGQRKIGHEWSLRWVRQRVIPSERQNIGQILRENGMDYYDEFHCFFATRAEAAKMSAIWPKPSMGVERAGFISS